MNNEGVALPDGEVLESARVEPGAEGCRAEGGPSGNGPYEGGPSEGSSFGSSLAEGGPSDAPDAHGHPAAEHFDVAIIGAGPAGLAAGLYASRAGVSVAVFERAACGGQLAQTERVDNYPGFPSGAGGFELAWSMKEQAERFGARIVSEEVTDVYLDRKEKRLVTPFAAYSAESVIIATGARPRKLGLPLEDDLAGRGVSYCATCDGGFFRDRKVVVVGGGNTAVADALYLSRIASGVVLVHRRDSLRATAVYHDQLAAAENIKLELDSRVVSLNEGDGQLRSVDILRADGSIETISAHGLFVAIGTIPNTEFLHGAIALDEGGYIPTDARCATGIEGVFAAGDVRVKDLRQVVTAVADGAVCAEQAASFLSV